MVPPDLSWVSMYWIFAVISLAMVGLIAITRFPSVRLKEDEKMGSAESYLELIRKPIVLMYFLGIFFYVGSEQGVNNWVSEFLQTYHGYDPQTVGAQVVSNFWGLMVLGTLLGLLLLKLVDSRWVLVGFSLGAIVSLAFGLWGPGEVALMAFPMVGFFASVMWSILISLALNSVEGHHGTFTGIMVTGIVGGAVWPLVIGSLGDVYGLKIGMLLLFVSLAYILMVGFWAKPIITNKTISLRKKELHSE